MCPARALRPSLFDNLAKSAEEARAFTKGSHLGPAALKAPTLFSNDCYMLHIELIRNMLCEYYMNENFLLKLSSALLSLLASLSKAAFGTILENFSLVTKLFLSLL
jgi:hypothetical protein